MDRNNTFKLGDAIGAFLKGHQLEERFFEAILKADWRDLMGDKVADKTNDISLEKGCLILYMSSAPLRQQLRLKQSRMIEYLNQKIGRGREPIRKVLIR
mgnify:CR=1 FL=1|tara:strand:+ start:3188 stop:3484 length:297 start_codon:yes stop_codon:yes gene_type:complete